MLANQYDLNVHPWFENQLYMLPTYCIDATIQDDLFYSKEKVQERNSKLESTHETRF